jgi:hypothetical protein
MIPKKSKNPITPKTPPQSSHYQKLMKIKKKTEINYFCRQLSLLTLFFIVP